MKDYLAPLFIFIAVTTFFAVLLPGMHALMLAGVPAIV